MISNEGHEFDILVAQRLETEDSRYEILAKELLQNKLLSYRFMDSEITLRIGWRWFYYKIENLSNSGITHEGKSRFRSRKYQNLGTIKLQMAVSEANVEFQLK